MFIFQTFQLDSEQGLTERIKLCFSPVGSRNKGTDPAWDTSLLDALPSTYEGTKNCPRAGEMPPITWMPDLFPWVSL